MIEENDPQWIVPETEIDHKNKSYHEFSAKHPYLEIVNKIKRTCRIIDFTILTNHRVKVKESEKRNNI